MFVWCDIGQDTPGKVLHRYMFPQLVENGSLCGLLELQSFSNHFIILTIQGLCF